MTTYTSLSQPLKVLHPLPARRATATEEVYSSTSSASSASNGPFAPSHALLMGTHMQTGIAVTPSKQTTVVLSNRNKKSPPGGVASWLRFRPTRRISNRYSVQTGMAVTHSKQTTVVLPNRYAKPSPGGVPSRLLFRPALSTSLAASSVEARPPDLWRANRYTVRIESAVTLSKQTALVHSNGFAQENGIQAGFLCSSLPFCASLF